MNDHIPGNRRNGEQEKNVLLYLRQKKLLDEFLRHGAISQMQYDKSFGDLTVKMGMREFAAQNGWEIKK